MALFDRFKQMLVPEEKMEKKVWLKEQEDDSSQKGLTPDGKPTTMDQSDRQVRVSQLTPREKDLYLLLLEGFTLKESAKQLGVKYSTANTHMTSIYRKLEVKSRAELIINYHRMNGGNCDE